MTPQPRTRPGIKQFLQDLKKADTLFWIVLILSVIFICVRWLLP